MLRLTGAALILGAALRLQRSLSVRGRLRRKTLRALANAFLSLESAVRSTLTPLPALLQELRCESEAASFFADVTAGLAPLLHLAVQYLFYQLAAFFSAVTGADPLCKFLEQLSSAFSLMLAMTAGGAFLLLVSFLIAMMMVVTV